ILLDANVNGKMIKAVAIPSKQSFLYVFDRITGQPIWPIEERPVQQSDVPGEKTAATQPFPTKPPAYGRPFLKVPDDLIDFTPAMRAQAIENLKNYRVAGMYNPPLLGKLSGGLRGAINTGNAGGGTNWPGAGADPETHTVFAQASMGAVAGQSLREPPPGCSDIQYVSGTAGTARRHARQRPQQPGTRGHDDSQDGPERQRRSPRHQDVGGARRSTNHGAARTAARRDAARVRQEQRERSRRRLAACSPERIADDLHGRRQAVHRRRRERRELFRRVHFIQPAGVRSAAVDAGTAVDSHPRG